jgi:hypothetical protein
MHRQSVGEFHYQAEHERMVLAAVFQKIRNQV